MSDSATSLVDLDPANQGTLEGLFALSARQIKMDIENCLPATIIGYDRASNRASVQPAIHMVTTQGELVKRAALASVTVMTMGGGGFNISFPMKAGDKGWIKSSDRDISLYLQSLNHEAPNTQRMHSFSDGFFIPDVVAKFIIAGEDSANMVISSTDGTVRIALWADKVKITAPTIVSDASIEIDAKATVRYRIDAPLFQVNAASIQFLTTPIVGALNPSV